MSTNDPADSVIRDIDGVMVIAPPNELFERTAIGTISDDWVRAVEAIRPTRVIVNFDRVTYFHSEAIGVIIRVAKRVRAHGGDIRLCCMAPVIREVFEVCQLIPVLFQVYDSKEDAIASFE